MFEKALIYKHQNADGSIVRVYDEATLPDITFSMSLDRPGIAAVSITVPEDFFANVLNRIHLGEGPTEVRHLGDSDAASGEDKQV